MGRRSRAGVDRDDAATMVSTLEPRPAARAGREACGPYDEADLDTERPDAAELVDFGAVRIPVPPGGTVTAQPSASGRPQAVNVSLPEGRLSVSALAAPKSSRLWPKLATEIGTSLRDGGALVRSFPGEWGRELHVNTGGTTSVFIGVDGARWMLYGVATGPAKDAVALDGKLRRMLKATVVVRGRSPYPVRTVLPLSLPEHLAEAAGAEGAAPARRDPVRADEPPTQVLPRQVPRPQETEPRDTEVTDRLPPVPGPAPVGRPAAAASRPGRHTAPEEDVAVRPRDGRDPALVFLECDPLLLFTQAAPGRHRRRE